MFFSFWVIRLIFLPFSYVSLFSKIAKDNKVREKEEDADKLRLADCKVYLLLL